MTQTFGHPIYVVANRSIALVAHSLALASQPDHSCDPGSPVRALFPRARTQAMMRKYGVVAIIGAFLLFILIYRLGFASSAAGEVNG